MPSVVRDSGRQRRSSEPQPVPDSLYADRIAPADQDRRLPGQGMRNLTASSCDIEA